MVAPEGLEPSRPKALVSKTSMAANYITGPLVFPCGFEPQRKGLQPSALPLELQEHGCPPRTRTETDRCLKPVPLPIGLEGNGRRSGSRTPATCSQSTCASVTLISDGADSGDRTHASEGGSLLPFHLATSALVDPLGLEPRTSANQAEVIPFHQGSIGSQGRARTCKT